MWVGYLRLVQHDGIETMSSAYGYGQYGTQHATQYSQSQTQQHGYGSGDVNPYNPNINGYNYQAQNEANQQYEAQQSQQYGTQLSQQYDAQQSQQYGAQQSQQYGASQVSADPVMGIVDNSSAAEHPREEVSQDSNARWSWNAYPMNRIEGARMVAPLGCMYAPLSNPCIELHYAPVACTVCGAVLNPYASYDGRSFTWNCPLCLSKGSLPSQYRQISDYSLPPEMQAENSTVEYVVSSSQHRAMTFIFVVDTCIDTEEELEGLKEFLLLALEKIPEYVNVGFISYGTTVQVHEVTNATSYPRSTILRGTEEMTPEKIKPLIPAQQLFVAPLASCAGTIRRLVKNLSRDLWPVMKGHRPLRCTGAALSVAASILQHVAPNTGSSIIAFMSGVCTTGPGIVVDVNREHIIRGHADIRDETSTASHWASSCAFYENLMQRMVAQGHALNCFTASLDQMGIAEMKTCIQSSGGVVLNAESWLQEPFRISLHQFFSCRPDGALRMGLNATIDVITSPTWKVQGVIGQCVGTGKRSSSVAEYEMGLGGTCQWTTCMLDETTTFAIYYDTAASAIAEANKDSRRYTQIVTRYEIGQEIRTRVTTLPHKQLLNPSIKDLADSFDQETAAVLLARLAIYKTDSMPLIDVMRWLDRTVVRLVSRFGTYTKDRPETLQLPMEFVFFPAFMYHFRRSGYLYVFNCSPDESAILRLQLLKSGVADSIVQIQPTLYRYRMDAAPQPVPLDSAAIQPDNILLLDTFFEVLIHYGATIAEWRKAGYADLEEYAYFKEFIEVPMNDAQILLSSRYPTPRLIDVCQDDPDARILYNRINPSRSYATAMGDGYGSNEGELVYTDDVSLQTFMQHLKKQAVSQ